MSRVLTKGQQALAPEILRLSEAGWRGSRIARFLNTSPATVCRVLSRLRVETWLREAHQEMQARQASTNLNEGRTEK
jgi:IS30 family transposase